ncbi:glycosyltransferase family 2 protein [Clostridium sp. LP20]|uniref:glycosyltransferase family 2 protein n=1 Tax=Clostridium sp. LP20 TaxID=3418665 RepID=UPI003EE78398
MKKVSIIMLAYNKLEYTKLAVDSLYKYTSNIDFEFITVNNGSSDGTKEFFDSLPNEKKINYETNVGGDRAFNEAIKQAEAEYTVFLNNDLIFTENWLENLIKVMESDPNIGVAVPVCNSSSNYQTVALEYYDTNMLQEVAKSYNKSDSSKWEERLRLMLYAAIFRTKELKEIGGLDEIYSPGGFDDDDLTCRYRRAGYKLVLTKDTYLHHYGSVTIGEAYAAILGRNRVFFKNKFGYDSWEANYINFNVVDNLNYINKEKIKILGIGESCGATILQIKNRLTELGNKNIELEYFSFSNMYTTDLNTICNRVRSGNIVELYEILEGEKFEYIYMDKLIYSISEIATFISKIRDNLCEDGTLIFNIKNISTSNGEVCSREDVRNLININGYKESRRITGEEEIDYYFICK